MLALRLDDGANQAGDYADASPYMPAGTGAAERWEPVAFDGLPQMATTPHWAGVMPFGLRRADQFRPPPPPTSAFTALTDALWAPEHSDGAARLDATDGLAIAFDGPGAGGGRSTPLDPLPHLTYQIVARVASPRERLRGS